MITNTSTDGLVQHYHTFTQFKWHDLIGWFGNYLTVRTDKLWFFVETAKAQDLAEIWTQTCVPRLLHIVIWDSFDYRGTVAMVYIAIARGSPWVVPSCENRVSPPYKQFYAWPVCVHKGRGHSFMTLFRATLRLRELKALVASTIRKASVAGSVKMDLATWTAASHPLVWPAQSCCDPTVSKMSKERTEAMALQMIHHAHSPTPIGRTPRHLSSVINLHATSGARSDGLRYSVHISWGTGKLVHHIGQLSSF